MPNFGTSILPAIWLEIKKNIPKVKIAKPRSDSSIFKNYKYVDEFLEQFNHEIIVFKIENLSNKSISVQWDTKIWYDNSCINCEQDSPEFRKNISIGVGKILESKCGEYDSFQLFSKFTDKLEDMPGVNKITMLTKFELKNLTITHE